MSVQSDKRRIKILDCTLRDGGLALDDALQYTPTQKLFTRADQVSIIESLNQSNIAFIEIGSVEITDADETGSCIYQDIESLSAVVPENIRNTKYAIFYRGPDTPLEAIPECRSDLCKNIRLCVRYSEQKKSIDYCVALKKKGYNVFIQPMVTMRYTNGELDNLIRAANDMQAYALYFVDSYGYMQYSDVMRLYDKYNRTLNDTIHIGFHAHNNINMAFSNVINFIQHDTKRNIIIDSTCLGMGQGAGNMQTEILTHYLNENYSSKYVYEAVLDVCSIIETYTDTALWGYSLLYLLPAINKTAYKFSVALKKKYNLSYRQIYTILKNMPDQFRHRFSNENLNELLKIFNTKLD